MSRRLNTDLSARDSLVYVATNQVNGQQYVGVTNGYLSQRMSKHFYSAEHGSSAHFHRAIRKYGRENFEFLCIVDDLTYDEANSEESRLISLTPLNYNLTAGGDGAVGYRHPPEKIEKMAQSRRGQPGPWLNKPLAQSFREGGRRWNSSPEGKRSWQECKSLGPKASSKPVVCLNDGNKFSSSEEAGRFYGIEPSSIGAICNRSLIRKSAGGLVFRFAGDKHGGKEEAEAVIASARASQLAAVASSRRNKKSVRCLDDGKHFETVKDAAEHYGINNSTVIRSCKLRNKYTVKRHFRYDGEL